MKITFINPSMTGHRRQGALQPLTFAALSGITPRDVARVLYDEVVEPIPLDEPTDLVAISASTFTARRAYQLAAQYRQRGVPVIMGGHHPTLLPDEGLRFADAVVCGDAERVWPQVLSDLADGRLRGRYSEPCTSLDAAAYDRSIFADKPYRNVHLVQFGRGCRFSCEFCSVHRFYGSARLQRPIASVAREVEELGHGHIFFVDDNLHTGRSTTKQLLQTLVPLRRRWSCQASLDIADDAERLRLLEKSGCFSILIGFESLNRETLGRMGKTWHRGRSQYEEVVHRLQDHGINVYGTFVFGYDEDTPDVFDECLAFVQRTGIFLASFNLLTPVPTTELFDRLVREGRMREVSWWLDPKSRFARLTYEPRGMTRDQIEAAAHRLRWEFFSTRSIFRRALNSRSARRSVGGMAFYLTANFVFRREVATVEFAPFGDPADDTLLQSVGSPGSGCDVVDAADDDVVNDIEQKLSHHRREVHLSQELPVERVGE